MKIPFICLSILMGVLKSILFVTPSCAGLLFLHHFDHSLDADHSRYGEPKTDAQGVALTREGQGFPFEGSAHPRALVAGYSDTSKKDAVARYSAVNLDSRRGTIEMWVKPNWDADLPNTRKEDCFRHFFSAPLENKGSMNFYYGCYRWNYFTPFIVFHINNGKPVKPGEQDPDYIINFRLAHDERQEGFVWRKGQWHYLVATWNLTVFRLFCDGKLMSERAWEKPVDIPPVAGPICIGNNSGNWGGVACLAEALIDEVRICDAPLFADLKTIPAPKTRPSLQKKSREKPSAPTGSRHSLDLTRGSITATECKHLLSSTGDWKTRYGRGSPSGRVSLCMASTTRTSRSKQSCDSAATTGISTSAR